MEKIIFWGLTPLVIVIQIMNHWVYSKGKLRYAYPLSMLAYALYIIIETYVALREPSQNSLLLFNLVNVWGFAMAAKGYRRIKADEKDSNV
jgi:uncharacterized membrane protein